MRFLDLATGFVITLAVLAVLVPVAFLVELAVDMYRQLRGSAK